MKVKNFVRKFGNSICTLALLVGITSVSAACYGWFHQPKVPECMRKMEK